LVVLLFSGGVPECVNDLRHEIQEFSHSLNFCR